MFFRRPSFFLLSAIALANIITITSCTKDDDDCVYVDPFPFPDIPEDNTGNRVRTITYVYDRTAVDQTYPPKIDSSVIQFAFDPSGKIERIRLTQNDSFFVYDFSFERNNNRLTAIHCKSWSPGYCDPEVYGTDMELEYNTSGKVSLMRYFVLENNPFNEVDSIIVKYNGSRIDTVIDRTFAVGTNVDKYAFAYNGSGDITQVDYIRTSGIFWVVEKIFKYTLSGNPAVVVLGDEALFWHFFATHVDVSSNTDYMIPSIFFHSAKQPSKLVLQESGFYTGTYNYQTEYYSSGRPKKMTADVITQSGAFYAREAYYYTYAQ